MFRSNKFSITILILLVFSCKSGPKKDPNRLYFEKASEYNTYITRQFDEVNRLWNATLPLMDDSILVYKQLDSLKAASKSSWDNMYKLADFNGDSLYRLASARYFEYMYKMAIGDFEEAIQIGLMEDVSDSLSFRFMAIGNQIGSDKDTLISNLKAAQLNFIHKNEQ